MVADMHLYCRRFAANLHAHQATIQDFARYNLGSSAIFLKLGGFYGHWL
jgi:hypothetical protein